MEDKTQMVSVNKLKELEDKGKSGKRNASLIVIAGSQVGQMYKVDDKDMVLGRGMDAPIRIDDDGISRKHAQVSLQEDGIVLLRDLGSTNGTYCNGERITAKVLEDGDRVQIGTNTILKFSFQDDVEEEFQKKLFNSATRDSLTGCYNKKYFQERIQTEFSYASRHNVNLSLIMFDIDHFKSINDTYGHMAGDYILKELARIVQETVRTEDVFARYGGEEFAIILREVAGESAFIAAERVRRAIRNASLEFNGQKIPVTVSLGVATFIDGNHQTAEDLIMKADEYLYKAKESGRNATECVMFQ